jgi:hypothetical protein
VATLEDDDTLGADEATLEADDVALDADDVAIDADDMAPGPEHAPIATRARTTTNDRRLRRINIATTLIRLFKSGCGSGLPGSGARR